MSHIHVSQPPTPKKSCINEHSTPKKCKEPPPVIDPRRDRLKNLRDTVENIRHRLQAMISSLD